MLTVNRQFCALLQEQMILTLGIRQKLIDIFVQGQSKVMCIGALRVIGEMCFQFDSEAVQFINANIINCI